MYAASGPPVVVSDGQFGEVAAPIFLDDVVCGGEEERLIDCPLSGHLGLRDEQCGADLGVVCPGSYYLCIRMYIHVHELRMYIHAY